MKAVPGISAVAKLPRSNYDGRMPMTRREALLSTSALAVTPLLRAQARVATQHRPAEWSFQSGKQYGDAFNDIELDVIFQDTAGKQFRAPAFWAGDQVWRVRFAAPTPGRYSWQSVCSDTSNKDLHDINGSLEVEPYTGSNSLLQHGGIRVHSD